MESTGLIFLPSTDIRMKSTSTWSDRNSSDVDILSAVLEGQKEMIRKEFPEIKTDIFVR